MDVGGSSLAQSTVLYEVSHFSAVETGSFGFGIGFVGKAC
jgi:hypothetical protein